jgi:hypothetical protein
MSKYLFIFVFLYFALQLFARHTIKFDPRFIDSQIYTPSV